MTEFSFDENPQREARLGANTRAKIYESLEEILAKAGTATDSGLIHAEVAVGESTLIDAPEGSLPIIAINKPTPDADLNYQWDYELTYGVQDATSSLHMLFPKAETERPPTVTGYEVVEGSSPTPATTRSGYPERELSESDAAKLLFDLHNIKIASNI